MRKLLVCGVACLGLAGPLKAGGASLEPTVESGVHVLIEAKSLARPTGDLECSVTASGTVESAELGTFTATITVTGPCDASLAAQMREAIAELRAAFK